MAYTPVPAVSAGDFGRASWATIVKNDLADHESRIVAVEATGTGDVVGPASSVEKQLSLFDGATGKLLEGATGTGYVKVTSGVYQTPSATIPLATDVSGNLPLANLPSSLAQVLKTQVTLTDAQIKALPTTPITLVPAPGSGKILKPMAVMLKLLASAAGYTNANTTYAELVVRYAGADWAAQSIANDSSLTAPLTYVTDFFAIGDRYMDLGAPYLDAFDAGNASGSAEYVIPAFRLPTSSENKALELFLENNGSGNLTGGNAANSLTVTVLYVAM